LFFLLFLMVSCGAPSASAPRVSLASARWQSLARTAVPLNRR